MKRYHIGVVVALLLTLGSPLAGLAAQSEETGPQPRHEAAAQIIGELLERRIKAA